MIWIKLSVYLLEFSSSGKSGGNLQEDEFAYDGLFYFISPFVIFLIYFVYLKRKQRHKIISWIDKKIPEVYSEIVYREIQIVLAVAMIKRDRYLFMNKRSRIHGFMQANYEGKKLDTDEIIDFFLDAKIPVMDLVDWCGQFLTYEQKLDTFSFLSQISLVDTELSDQEKEYLLFLIQRLKIRDQDIAENLADRLFERKNKNEKPVLGYVRYYLVLELTEKASAREIKEAYRKLVKKYHPDSRPDLSEEEKRQLAQKFHEVQEAYDVLVNV